MAGSLSDSPVEIGSFGNAAWVLRSAASFRIDVVAESLERPVLAFFCSDDPSTQLIADLLKKAVEATNGKVKLVLLEINEARQIARQLGVQATPAAISFQAGAPTDGFAGKIPQKHAFSFVDRLTGGLLNFNEALDPEHESLLVTQDGCVIADLRRQIVDDPENQELCFKLALALNEAGHRELAANMLLDLIRHDRSWGDDQARKKLISFFDRWGPLDPTTISSRRKLSAVLFS